MGIKFRRYLPVIGIGIFIYILLKINIYNILVELENINLSLLLIAFIFVISMLFIQTFKWFIIAKKQKMGILFGEAFKINLISNFYGFITPSKVGSVIRADYLKKYSGNIGKGISNFVIDKVFDIFSLFFLAILIGYVFKDKFNFFSLNYLIVISFAMLVLFLIFYNKKNSKILLRMAFKKILPKRIKEKAKLTFESFYENLPKKRFLFFVFIINIITWINIYLITYFIGLSLGIELGFIYFLAILPLTTLVAQIPITINGLGTREAAMIGLFGLFNISAAKVFSMSILAIIITGILPALIASFLILRNK